MTIDVIFKVAGQTAAAIRWLLGFVDQERHDMSCIMLAGDALFAADGVSCAAIKTPVEWPTDRPFVNPRLIARDRSMIKGFNAFLGEDRDSTNKTIRDRLDRIPGVRPASAPTFEIVMDARRLRNLLALAAQKNAAVRLVFWGPEKPMEIRTTGDCWGMLMPMYATTAADGWIPEHVKKGSKP